MWKEERKGGRGTPSLSSELLLEIENSARATGLRGVPHSEHIVVSLPDGSQPTPLLSTHTPVKTPPTFLQRWSVWSVVYGR